MMRVDASTNANFEIVKSKDQTSSPHRKLGKEPAQRFKAMLERLERD